MNNIKVNTIVTDGKARLNEVTLNDKTFKTPMFMPDRGPNSRLLLSIPTNARSFSMWLSVRACGDLL